MADNIAAILANTKNDNYFDKSNQNHLPLETKQILKDWMYNHRHYCYPTNEEKAQLASQTNLSVQQVSNWFVNARRRILPEILKGEGKNPKNYTITRKSRQAKYDASPEGTDSCAPIVEEETGPSLITALESFEDDSSLAFPLDSDNEQNADFDENTDFSGILKEFIAANSPQLDDIACGELLTVESANGDEVIQELNVNVMQVDDEPVEEAVLKRGIIYDANSNFKCAFFLLETPIQTDHLS